MPSVAGKVVLITGGARRVGAAIARCLHQEGMDIVLHYWRSKAEAQALQDELEQARPHSVALIQGDLASLPDIERIVQQATTVFGGLDALVNNASNFYSTPVGRVRERDWDDLLAVNLKGPFFVCQAAAAALEAREGVIVNLIDIHAERPLKDYPVYSIAKAGLGMLTRTLARELAPAVRVNGVAPGTILWPEAGLPEAIKTEILARTPRKREGAPEDVAAAVRFFIRDAPYVSGQILAVDGGRAVVL